MENKFLGIINYREFKKLPDEAKIKQLIDKNILELDLRNTKKTKHHKQHKHINSLLNLEEFHIYTLDNKKFYRISTLLIDEIQKYLYEIFKRYENQYYLEIEEINIKLRKTLSLNIKEEELIKIHNEHITNFNNSDTLDFLEENNMYLSDKSEFLKSEFNNDLLLYDFDFIYYSIIYNNANKVFNYVFNSSWLFSQIELLKQILKLYEGKKIITFCTNKLSSLSEPKTVPKIAPKEGLSSNQRLILLDQIRYISEDDWDNLDTTKKAKLISKITGYGNENIRKNIPNLSKKNNALPEQFKKDISLVKTILKDTLG